MRIQKVSDNRSFAMEKAIRLRVRKDLDPRQHLTVIRLKGNLISKGYTEIIHIMDQDDEFHINSFEILPEHCREVQEYISGFISQEDLADAISIKLP